MLMRFLRKTRKEKRRKKDLFFFSFFFLTSNDGYINFLRTRQFFPRLLRYLARRSGKTQWLHSFHPSKQASRQGWLAAAPPTCASSSSSLSWCRSWRWRSWRRPANGKWSPIRGKRKKRFLCEMTSYSSIHTHRQTDTQTHTQSDTQRNNEQHTTYNIHAADWMRTYFLFKKLIFMYAWRRCNRAAADKKNLFFFHVCTLSLSLSVLFVNVPVVDCVWYAVGFCGPWDECPWATSRASWTIALVGWWLVGWLVGPLTYSLARSFTYLLSYLLSFLVRRWKRRKERRFVLHSAGLACLRERTFWIYSGMNEGGKYVRVSGNPEDS